MLLLSSEDLHVVSTVFTIYATLFLDFVAVIGGTNIYLTLIITGVECIEKNGQAVYDQVIWDELKAEVQLLM